MVSTTSVMSAESRAGTSASAILRRRKHVLPAFVVNIRERLCG